MKCQGCLTNYAPPIASSKNSIFESMPLRGATLRLRRWSLAPTETSLRARPVFLSMKTRLPTCVKAPTPPRPASPPTAPAPARAAAANPLLTGI